MVINMKYVVILCDGMADRPIESLGGKTPMEAANKPNMDALAKNAEIGLCKTVADGLNPGSDVANLSVLGYDPKTCYSGRSPLEAASMGLTLSDSEIALRCNLVTLSGDGDYESRVMDDYCAGDISTEDAQEVIAALNEHFATDKIHFHTGVSYRHCLIYDGGELGLSLTPPHDISGRVIGKYLSNCEAAKPFTDMMKQSAAFLPELPVNKRRIKQGKKPANSAWFWGEGKRPALSLFRDKYGLTGSVISAVDLIKGIGRLAGMTVCEVEGATGYIDTNFDGKATAAIEEIRRGQDFVFVHVEAPDECGHRGETENKVLAIEQIDQKVLGPILCELEKQDAYKIMILPDHPTPLSIKTHTSDPVPYLIYEKGKNLGGGIFSEAGAEDTGIYIQDGIGLMPRFLGQ